MPTTPETHLFISHSYILFSISGRNEIENTNQGYNESYMHRNVTIKVTDVQMKVPWKGRSYTKEPYKANSVRSKATSLEEERLTGDTSTRVEADPDLQLLTLLVHQLKLRHHVEEHQ